MIRRRHDPYRQRALDIVCDTNRDGTLAEFTQLVDDVENWLRELEEA
jgi:hypothetical protein